MTISNFKHIDWLSITIPSDANWRKFLPLVDWQGDGKGMHGYARRYVSKSTGAVVETGSKDKSMGHHFTLSGAPLSELRAQGMTDDELVQAIDRFSGKTSRIDLTIDAWGVTFTPAGLRDAIRDKCAKIPTRTYRLIAGHAGGMDGDTFETGAKTSDKRFRLYDKFAEKRIKSDESWMRLELQLRRLYARNACLSCIENGVDSTITGHIADYVKWSNDEYNELIAGNAAAPERTQRHQSKRRAWLSGQVARALAAEIVMDADYRVEFDIIVNYWIEKAQKLDT